MKQFTFLLVCFAISLNCLSQTPKWCATASLNLKWGIIDEKGEWLLEPGFEELVEVNENSYIVRKNGKYGLIDRTGNIILPIQFDELTFNSPGFFNAKQNKLFGIIDLQGNWIIQPKSEYRSFGELKDNTVLVTDASFNTGLINTKGEWLSKQKKGDVTFMFSTDLIAFKDENLKYGFKGKSGEWIIKPQFESAENFIQGIDLALVKLDGKLGYIDKSGKWVLKASYSTIQNVTGSNNLVYCEDKINNQCGIYDLKARRWINEQMPSLGYLSFNKAGNFIRVRSKAAVYGDENDQVIEAYCENKYTLPSNYSKIRLSAREGLLDLNGKWVIEPQKYYRLREINDSLFIVQYNSKLERSGNDFKFGIIDAKGNWVVAPDYDNISFEIKFCITQKDKKYGLINAKGQVVTEPIYDKTYTLETAESPGLAKYKQQEKWGVIDGNGTIITPAIYDDAAAFKEHLILVKQNLMWGVIDKKGKWQVEPKFDEIGY